MWLHLKQNNKLILEKVYLFTTITHIQQNNAAPQQNNHAHTTNKDILMQVLNKTGLER